MFSTVSSNEDSTKMLRHLELIDDEASQYGVKLVKLDDPLMAKKYGHRDPPGLGYFRKGNYLKYEGNYFTQLFLGDRIYAEPKWSPI